MKPLLLVGLLVGSIAWKSRRFRRQALPSQHIQVHSFDSNVLINNFVTVVSSESRIDLSEKNVNGSIWSEHSTLSFDSYDTFVNCSAQMAESFFNIQNNALVHTQAVNSYFFMKTNRTIDGQSYIIHDLYENTTMSVEDDGLRVQAIGGRQIGIDIHTWEQSVKKKMSLTSNMLHNGDNELVLSAIAPLYNIRICFLSAMIYVEFGDKVIEIKPDYKSVQIFTNKYTLNIKTNISSYDVSLSNEEILIRCSKEHTIIRIQPTSIDIHVEQLSKMQVDRGGGEMSLGNHIIHPDSVKITSLETMLNLLNSGHIRANMKQSHTVVQTSVQNVGMTAAHQELRVDGGIPHFMIQSGETCIEVTANHGKPKTIDLLPPFVRPVDKFINIGPYQVTLYPHTWSPVSNASDIYPFPTPVELGAPPELLETTNDSDRCAACRYTTATENSTLNPHTTKSLWPSTGEIDGKNIGISYSSDSSTISAFEPSNVNMGETAQSMTSSSIPTELLTGKLITSTLPTTHRFTASETLEIQKTENNTTQINQKMDEFPESTSTSLTEITNHVTLDQFVVGQFGTLPQEIGDESNTVPISATISSIKINTKTPIFVESPDFPIPRNLNWDHTLEPSKQSINSTNVDLVNITVVPLLNYALNESETVNSDGGGGSWMENDGTFPKPEFFPQNSPMLTLKLKIPEEQDFNSIKLAKNLTAGLNSVVLESMRRVRRQRRAVDNENTEYNLVHLYRLEREGENVNVVFSVKETELDAESVERELYLLDENVLSSFLNYPVASTVSRLNFGRVFDTMLFGLFALLVSITFLCYLFRTLLKRLSSMLFTDLSQKILKKRCRKEKTYDNNGQEENCAN